MESTQEHLLADEAVVNLEMASSGKRFANYLIDIASFYAFIFALSLIIVIFNPTFFDVFENASAGVDLLDRLVTLLLYGLYMGTVEAVFKGRTLGKLLTGTRAVNEDGSTISMGTAFKRGIIRAIPFNAFSALGNPCYPWQDKWSDTYVVDVKKSILPANE
ncbi:RDD family protein [Chitinophaga lutea]|uniref:RDD family protein n=1 Tax=Chitinophaga lutea TaxID=2488634 RepID=A0A3N4PBD1_9BACT|nr:RDD family protein [Chitinophaga lutea]RPE05943.1 RDD family protein [Chitinophaga lutea]